jgi:predicted aconitase with swiveling domain
MIRARVLSPADVQGPVLALGEPLSFLGGFDPRTGEIIDVHHPQRGKRLGGVILLMEESRGSGSAPGAIAEAIRLGTAPFAIILTKDDVNLSIGATVAATLYGTHCAILIVTREELERLRACKVLSVTRDGVISEA